MSRPAFEQFDPGFLRALQVQLKAPHFGVQYPIRLTAQDSYVFGRAALVFINPHGLSPADDVAQFGECFAMETQDEVWDYKPPHQDARLVAWFRPPEANGKYNIDFSILCSPGSYSLASGDGTETTEITGTGLDLSKQLSTTFYPNSNEWRSFTLSGTNYWVLRYCELNPLP